MVSTARSWTGAPPLVVTAPDAPPSLEWVDTMVEMADGVTIEDLEEFVAFAWTNGILDERFGDKDPADDDEALAILDNALLLGLLAPDDEVPGVSTEECPICGLPELGSHEASCEEATV